MYLRATEDQMVSWSGGGRLFKASCAKVHLNASQLFIKERVMLPKIQLKVA